MLIVILFLIALGCNLHVCVSAAQLRVEIQPNKNVSVKKNDDLTLTCNVVGEAFNRTYAMSWILPSKKSEDIFSRVSFNNSNNVLAVSVLRMQKSDSGQYICEVKEETDNEIYSRKINVLVNSDWERCAEPYFDCGRSCIPLHYVCNGFKDCPNGSDESIQNCVELESSEAPVQYKFHSLGFYQSTVYTMISCAIAFIFMSTIMLIAVCRIRMRRNACFQQTSRSSQRSSIPPLHTCSQDGRPVRGTGLHDSIDPLENFVLLTYDNNTGFEVAEYGPKPPPYAESSVCLGVPPPPYSSMVDISQQSLQLETEEPVVG